MNPLAVGKFLGTLVVLLSGLYFAPRVFDSEFIAALSALMLSGVFITLFEAGEFWLIEDARVKE